MLESLFKREKRLQHKCFPVKFEKFLRTLFFIEHLGWLFLALVIFAKKTGSSIRNTPFSDNCCCSKVSLGLINFWKGSNYSYNRKAALKIQIDNESLFPRLPIAGAFDSASENVCYKYTIINDILSFIRYISKHDSENIF